MISADDATKMMRDGLSADPEYVKIDNMISHAIRDTAMRGKRECRVTIPEISDDMYKFLFQTLGRNGYQTFKGRNKFDLCITWKE